MSLDLHKHLSGKQKTTVIDNLMTVAAVVHPLTAVPQVVKIYTSHDVSGVSIWTWLGFMALGLVFLAYGLAHQLKPFILTQILWFIVDTLVVVGILLYR